MIPVQGLPQWVRLSSRKRISHVEEKINLKRSWSQWDRDDHADPPDWSVWDPYRLRRRMEPTRWNESDPPIHKQADKSPASLRLEVPTEVRAHRRRRLGLRPLPAEDTGSAEQLTRRTAGRRYAPSSQVGTLGQHVKMREQQFEQDVQREVRLPSEP